MSEKKPRLKWTVEETWQAVAYIRLLAAYGCAGSPACESLTADAATGKREGGLCGPCEAAEWLAERGLAR